MKRHEICLPGSLRKTFCLKHCSHTQENISTASHACEICTLTHPLILPENTLPWKNTLKKIRQWCPLITRLWILLLCSFPFFQAVTQRSIFSLKIRIYYKFFNQRNPVIECKMKNSPERCQLDHSLPLCEFFKKHHLWADTSLGCTLDFDPSGQHYKHCDPRFGPECSFVTQTPLCPAEFRAHWYLCMAMWPQSSVFTHRPSIAFLMLWNLTWL
jgi:hypothetical protein